MLLPFPLNIVVAVLASIGTKFAEIGVAALERHYQWRKRMRERWLAWRAMRQPAPMHPARAAVHEYATFGERAADAVATGLGSWVFIGIQTSVIIGWILLNVLAWIGHWDPYPFILLNLLFSTQAAYAAPILQLSGNRQSQKDRKRDDLEAREVGELTTMNRTQLEILARQNEVLAQIAKQQEEIGELKRLVMSVPLSPPTRPAGRRPGK